jgi:ABC-type Zn uptake system ZnuABC Zn-binding protein ZnuA
MSFGRRLTLIVALVALGACGGGSSDTVDTVAVSTSESVEDNAPGTDSTVSSIEVLPVVVVTYSPLQSIVEDIVGDAARVEVVIPNGTDPHDFEPSAKDVETMSSAALVVSNGLDLEEGLEDALGEVEKVGVPVFHIADHVTLRDGSKDEHSHDDADTTDDHSHGEEDAHDHGSTDPHVWLDPLTLAEAIPALTDEIGGRIGKDLSASGEAVVASLAALHADIEERIGTLESCVVITGHDSLGYFGARYGCEVLGSIIPSFSTAAEATAKDLAELKELAETEGVKAIFTELGTPADVAEQLASEVGVEVVEIATHLVPDGGGYDEMMLVLTEAIVGGLS